MNKLFILILLLSLAYFSYNLKAAMGIKIRRGGEHSPIYIERWTNGLVKCKWFANPHHCK